VSDHAPLLTAVEGDSGAYAEDGTDLTLIHWMLDMTPGERLDVLTSGARSLLSLRRDDALR